MLSLHRSTRWCQLELSKGRIFVADAGAMSIGGYQHNSFQERSLLGGEGLSGFNIVRFSNSFSQSTCLERSRVPLCAGFV